MMSTCARLIFFYGAADAFKAATTYIHMQSHIGNTLCILAHIHVSPCVILTLQHQCFPSMFKTMLDLIQIFEIHTLDQCVCT